MKKNEAPYPLDIGILGPYAAVLEPNPFTNPIQQLWRLSHGGETSCLWDAKF